jgi:hypothetical protein
MTDASASGALRTAPPLTPTQSNQNPSSVAVEKAREDGDELSQHHDIEAECEPDAEDNGSIALSTFSQRKIHGWMWFLLVVSILSTTFLFALDNTIVANIQPAIVEEFNGVSKLSWISVATLLGAASTNLIW